MKTETKITIIYHITIFTISNIALLVMLGVILFTNQQEFGIGLSYILPVIVIYLACLFSSWVRKKRDDYEWNRHN